MEGVSKSWHAKGKKNSTPHEIKVTILGTSISDQFTKILSTDLEGFRSVVMLPRERKI